MIVFSLEGPLIAEVLLFLSTAEVLQLNSLSKRTTKQLQRPSIWEHMLETAFGRTFVLLVQQQLQQQSCLWPLHHRWLWEQCHAHAQSTPSLQVRAWRHMMRSVLGGQVGVTPSATAPLPHRP